MKARLVGLCALLLLPALWGALQDVDAGTTKYSNLGNILTTASDTTEAWDAFRYNGAGFIVTWTDEDSITVTIQSTIDGTTWFNLKSVTIDGGTTGPFNAYRVVEAVDSGASFSNFGATNLPIGYRARAIVTSAGADTAQSVKILFTFPS